MCTKQFINAFNSLTLKDLKEFIPEDVWESVVDSIDWKGLVLKGTSEPNEKVNDRSERMRHAAKARWEKTKATKADEVTTTVVEPKEEVVTPEVVEDTTDVVEPYVEPIAVEKMEDVLMQQEETLKEDTKEEVTHEVVEVTPEEVETPKPTSEPLIKKQEVYTYQNTGNPYLYRPVEDAATPEQKNVDEQWQLFDKAAWELKDSTNVAQLEQFLLKMDTWWKKFGTMELNPDYNMANHLIKNRIADLKGIPV